MIPYNVDLLDKNMDCYHHITVEPFPIDSDYLYPNVSTFEIPHTTKDLSNIVFIWISQIKFFGFVSSIAPGEELDTVSIKSIQSMFSIDVLYDMTVESDKGTSLEEYLKYFIESEYVTNPDTYQNYSHFSVRVDSRTEEWKFGFEPLDEESNYALVNLYDNIICSALTNCQVAINAEFIPETRVVNFIISKNNQTIYIDSDLPSCTIEEFTIKDQSESINKLVVKNGHNVSEEIIYYVHNDETYDTEDRDRVLPVLRGLSVITPSEDESFDDLAAEEAAQQFTSQAWRNLIQLRFMSNDALVNPQDLMIGQDANIIYEGTAYNSILTGRIYDIGQISLIFGKIRFDMTKVIKDK